VNCTARIKKPPTGVLLLPRLNDIGPSLVRWREKAPVRPVLRS
jgi:hypothetical protein